ncbi:hypothetical protein FVE85_8139 [Porphyridium purpureum]|uniref:Gem-associated protein 2 n=1 Tax=Porphyridium purpureum TaxID=35688 RepID=A0A5J4YNT7_PORPP|nr:hypothetical protein FVE85_8139 [Porphyridium purpureum]|eukprot:POR5581..scf295_9
MSDFEAFDVGSDNESTSGERPAAAFALNAGGMEPDDAIRYLLAVREEAAQIPDVMTMEPATDEDQTTSGASEMSLGGEYDTDFDDARFEPGIEWEYDLVEQFRASRKKLEARMNPHAGAAETSQSIRVRCKHLIRGRELDDLYGMQPVEVSSCVLALEQELREFSQEAVRLSEKRSEQIAFMGRQLPCLCRALFFVLMAVDLPTHDSTAVAIHSIRHTLRSLRRLVSEEPEHKHVLSACNVIISLSGTIFGQRSAD